MTYRLQGVPVDGGDLTVGVWGDEGPLVVAAHGITSHHLGYGLVGPDCTIRDGILIVAKNGVVPEGWHV